MNRKILYFEEVREGDEAPPVVVSNITRTQIVKYAGASGDFNPIHHDELYAIRAGNDRVFAMGDDAVLSAAWLPIGSRMRNLRKYRVRFAAESGRDTVT
jgi:acyl dehydratase